MISRRTIVLTVAASILSLVGFATFAEEAPPAGAGAQPGAAPVQLPPWVTPDLIKAEQAMNMTPEQQTQFNQITGDFVTAHFAMVQKESKRGAPNLDMTIRSKDKGLVHKMDDQVKTLLKPEQMPAYENYKKVLQAGLKP